MNKSKFTIIFLLLAGLILIGAGCGKKPTVLEKKPEYLVYQDADFSFSLSYPETWTKEEQELGKKGEQMGFKKMVAFLTPQENDQDSFQENFIISVMKWDPSVTYEQFAKANIDNLSAHLDFHLFESGPTDLAGQSAYKFIYGETNEGLNFKYYFTYTAKGSTLYTLNYTASLDSFDKFMEDVQKMIDSFKIF